MSYCNRLLATCCQLLSSHFEPLLLYFTSLMCVLGTCFLKFKQIQSTWWFANTALAGQLDEVMSIQAWSGTRRWTINRGPTGFRVPQHLFHPPSLSPSLCPCLSFLSVCPASSPAKHSVISQSPVGVGSKSAQLDRRHQSQPTLRMGHSWAHREAFPLHFKWETNVAVRKRCSAVVDEHGGRRQAMKVVAMREVRLAGNKSDKVW